MSTHMSLASKLIEGVRYMAHHLSVFLLTVGTSGLGGWRVYRAKDFDTSNRSCVEVCFPLK